MEANILQPLLAWMLLVVVVALRLAFCRVRDFTQQRLSTQAYAFRDGRRKLSEAAERASDHYQNQFEMPVLFVAACLAVHLTQQADMFYLVLAWVYVALRVLHTMVHLTYNRVYHRFLLFVAGFVPLAIMIVRLSWQLFFRGA